MVLKAIEFRKDSPYQESELQKVAEILENEWPTKVSTGCSIERRKRFIFSGTDSDNASASSFGIYSEEYKTTIGFFRLRKGFSDSVGNTCVIVSVVVDEKQRNKGLGRRLMNIAENKARDLGYEYIYLWTDNASSFYRKCGYEECEPILISSPIFSSLQSRIETRDNSTSVASKPGDISTHFLSSLGSTLLKKQSLKTREYIARVGEDDTTINPKHSNSTEEKPTNLSIWMRKCLEKASEKRTA